MREKGKKSGGHEGSAPAKPGTLDGVLVGDRVVVGPYTWGATWQTYAVTRTTETQVIAGSMRFKRATGRLLRTVSHLCARPETAEERLDREARTPAEATVCAALHLSDACLRHVSTARLAAIAAACEVTP